MYPPTIKHRLLENPHEKNDVFPATIHLGHGEKSQPSASGTSRGRTSLKNQWISVIASWGDLLEYNGVYIYIYYNYTLYIIYYILYIIHYILYIIYYILYIIYQILYNILYIYYIYTYWRLLEYKWIFHGVFLMVCMTSDVLGGIFHNVRLTTHGT